jgi:glutaredoxin
VRAIVYVWSSCKHCESAKRALAEAGVEFREVVLDGKKEELRRLQDVFGARTMPLVLLDGRKLAGLEALESALAEESAD